jgi:hypothetical protein
MALLALRRVKLFGEHAQQPDGANARENKDNGAASLPRAQKQTGEQAEQDGKVVDVFLHRDISLGHNQDL